MVIRRSYESEFLSFFLLPPKYKKTMNWMKQHMQTWLLNTSVWCGHLIVEFLLENLFACQFTQQIPKKKNFSFDRLLLFFFVLLNFLRKFPCVLLSFLFICNRSNRTKREELYIKSFSSYRNNPWLVQSVWLALGWSSHLSFCKYYFKIANLLINHLVLVADDAAVVIVVVCASYFVCWATIVASKVHTVNICFFSDNFVFFFLFFYSSFLQTIFVSLFVPEIKLKADRTE